MDQKKQRLAALACFVLFLAIWLLSSVFSTSSSSEWDDSGSNPVVISEILPSNRTYPDQDGQHLDFVEIHNLSADSVDISGYMLSDDLSSIGYTFPDNTVLPPHGYIACWCNPGSEDDRYANFGISREGAETIYLYNSANVVVDQKALSPMESNISLVRIDATTWEEAAFATPGFANTEEGYRQWLGTVTGGDIKVTITEVMTDNSCVASAPDTQPCDWVELTNTGTTMANLSGAYLSNDPADPLKWQIPELTIAPGEAVILYCAGNQATPDQAPFGLSKTGCTVILTSNLGNTLSRVDCPTLLTDFTWSLASDGSYLATDRPTPGFENSEAGYSAWMASVGAEQMQIAISEVMTSNRSTLLSTAGKLCDWVELTNTGSVAVNLDGAFLSDDPAERGKWRISGLTLAPGQSAVIPCAGSEAGENEADFALSSSGCTVTLSGSAGNIISQVVCPTLDNDRVWTLQEDGTYRQTDTPTPGLANTDDNHHAYRDAQAAIGPLAVTEVMPSNDKYMLQSDGRYYDWVELTNISGNDLDLSNFFLSDDPDDLSAFRLPQRTLKPGEQIVIICSARDGLVGKYIHAPFTLSAEECWVYVTDSSGSFSDYLRISNVPDNCSFGRSMDGAGNYYFEQPTPGNPNGTGVALISQMPAALTAPGIYNDVPSVSVALEGNGTLHYTLDGSVPTAQDPVYSQPLTFSATTVLRAVSFEEGKLPSRVLTASYIVNENHTLPVLSLTAMPDTLLGAAGIYHQSLPKDNEIPCNLSLFEENGSFSMDCGLEMMATNTAYPEKKSMKVNFRGRYGEPVLGYPVFGEDGPAVFDALCLQAGPEHGLTLFRDELFTELCLQLTDSVPARRYKFCVLYLNGQYHGIYSLKEDISEMLYSQQMEVAQADVIMAEETNQLSSDLYSLGQFCKETDLSQQGNFDQFASQVDLENLMDWMILQGYCCNDSIANDLRYFRTPETGSRWQLGFFDLDGGFTSRTGFQGVFDRKQPYHYVRFACGIAENPAARQQFLERLGQALDTTLSNENVLSLIESFEATLSPEMSRERVRWGSTDATWQADVARLKTYLTRYDHRDMLLNSLRQSIALTDEETAILER